MQAASTDAAAPIAARASRPLVYRQSAWTRITHWVWAFAMFFLLLSGLQIFNAHPALYLGRQSGFGFDNALVRIAAEDSAAGPRGYVDVLGTKWNTTGVLGLSGSADDPAFQAFPSWATIPSFHDLATGRVVHFFFAWVFVGALLVWLVASLWNGHLRRDVAPGAVDLRALPQDVKDHAHFRFHHTRAYSPLQKLSYAGVLFVVMPLIVVTGLAMSPSFNATVPFLNDLLGGRQTARTIHFACMALLVLFFVVHMLMVVAAGPFNELRSIITGWYRIDPPDSSQQPQPGE
jgi:thiosulfate reductase cytochrome b subunit